MLGTHEQGSSVLAAISNAMVKLCCPPTDDPTLRPGRRSARAPARSRTDRWPFAQAVAGVDGRHVAGRPADGGAQGRVLSDERHKANPRRNGVDRLGQRHPDHRTDRVAGTPGPACRLKLGEASPNTRAPGAGQMTERRYLIVIAGGDTANYSAYAPDLPA